jgi:hypothetical protein
MTTKRFKQILILSLVVLVVFYICLGIGVAKIKKHRSETQTTLPTLMTSDVQPRTTAPQEAPAVTIGGNQVTSGSLPSIAAEMGEGGICKTSVQLGDLVIGNDTTVKEFSTAVLANNEDFLNGDKITVFVAHQILDAVTSIPRVVIKATDLVLDREDEVTLLRDTAQAVGFSSVDGCLASSGMVDGAIVWIHSRREAGMTKVSSRRFLVSNGILAQYQTQTKKEEAILSYGGTIKELYLTPTSNDVEVAHVNP